MKYIRFFQIDYFCICACDREISDINVGSQKVLLVAFDKPTFVKSFFL